MSNSINCFESFKKGFESGSKAFLYTKNKNEKNEDYMDHAIEMASLSESGDKKDNMFFGREIPQPKIGAVLVCGDKVFCAARSGFKHGDHAEFTVLETMNAPEHLENSILFTTLEPCTPDSRCKTESCSEIIINRKLKTVYIGTLDSNPLVLGRGINSLIKEGIEIHFFASKYKDRLNELNKDFFDFCKEYPDIKLLKMIEDQIGSHLDYKAIHSYMKSDGDAYDEIDVIDVDELILFYRKMIRKEQIITGIFDKTISCTKDFVLAFFKKPSDFLCGYNAGIIDKRNQGSERISLDQSLISLLNKKNPNNVFNKIGNCVGVSLESFDSFDSFISSIFPNFILTREIITNAFAHNDYSKNTGAIIEVHENSIKVCNTTDFDALANRFERNNKGGNERETEKKGILIFSMPFNPGLMEFLKEAKLVENTNFGFSNMIDNEKALKNKVEYSKEQRMFSVSIDYLSK